MEKEHDAILISPRNRKQGGESYKILPYSGTSNKFEVPEQSHIFQDLEYNKLQRAAEIDPGQMKIIQ